MDPKVSEISNYLVRWPVTVATLEELANRIDSDEGAVQCTGSVL